MVRNKKKLEAQCQRWNDEHPVGAAVIVTLDDGKEVRTVTRSLAQVLEGHTAVIWLRGISGCYSLDRVRVCSEERLSEEKGNG